MAVLSICLGLHRLGRVSAVRWHPYIYLHAATNARRLTSRLAACTCDAMWRRLYRHTMHSRRGAAFSPKILTHFFQNYLPSFSYLKLASGGLPCIIVNQLPSSTQATSESRIFAFKRTKLMRQYKMKVTLPMSHSNRELPCMFILATSSWVLFLWSRLTGSPLEISQGRNQTDKHFAGVVSGPFLLT